MTEHNDQDPKHYEWWHNAVARVQAGYGPRDLGVVSDGYPECGFYRLKKKGQTAAAVAIYYQNGELVGKEYRAGERPRDLDKEGLDAVWTWVAKGPVPHEIYEAFVETGRWPDTDYAVAEQVEAPAGIGHNNPPEAKEADEVAIFADQIESAKAGLEAYATIEDDETLAKAQSLRARLNELSREADKKREAEKRPHLEEGRKVDAKWQPLVKGAKEGADTVAKAMNAYETAKLQRRREEERKAEEARRAAEKEAREAEAAGAPPTAPEPEPAPAPAPVASSTIRGGYGRAASSQVVMVVTGITDISALLDYLKDHPEMQALALNLAKRAVKSGRTDVPGVKIEEQARVA